MLRLLSASLLLAPAAGFNLAARVPKTLATCDARRSSDAVARLGFLQDTRMGEMAGAESTTYGDLYSTGMSPLAGMYGGIASTRGYGMGGMYGGYGMAVVRLAARKAAACQAVVRLAALRAAAAAMAAAGGAEAPRCHPWR